MKYEVIHQCHISKVERKERKVGLEWKDGRPPPILPIFRVSMTNHSTKLYDTITHTKRFSDSTSQMDKNLHRAIVIVPTYNEKENIQQLIKEILTQKSWLEVLVVDDNSPDGTGRIVDELSSIEPRVHVIHHPGKLGLGTAYIAGFKHALRDGFEYILTMDGDFSHDPKYLPRLVELMKNADVAIGSRYVPEGGTKNWGWYRKLLSKGANAVARAILGMKAHDCTAGFRCYKNTVLQNLDLDGIFSTGYSFLVETLYRCQERNFSISELPIIFVDRRFGYTKISKKEIFKGIYTVFRLKFRAIFRRVKRGREQKG